MYKQLNPIKLAKTTLTVGAFNRLGLWATTPDKAYCYAFTVSSLVVAITITSTHYAYPRRDGQAELAWVA